MGTTATANTKVTVWITPTAMTSLEAQAERFDDTKTDTINRALIYRESDTRPGWRRFARTYAAVIGILWTCRWIAELVLPNLPWPAQLLLAAAAGSVVAMWVLDRPKPLTPDLPETETAK